MTAPEVLITDGSGVLSRRVVECLGSAGVEARILSRSGRPGTIRGDLSTGRDSIWQSAAHRRPSNAPQAFFASPARRTSKGQNACSRLLQSQTSHTSFTLYCRHRLRFILIEITGQRKRTLVFQLPGKTGRAFRGGR
jgi:hypothetical protein